MYHEEDATTDSLEGGIVSIRVYSRLGDVLRRRGVSVTDLRASIADRFGLTADQRTLARWARPTRVRRLDLELAWAIAAVLGVELGEVFTSEGTTEVEHRSRSDAIDSVLEPIHERRLQDLYDVQADRGLTEAERDEMGALVAAYNRRLYERGLHVIAEREGRDVGDVTVALANERAAISARYQEVEADPTRRDALVRAALERQRSRIAR